MTAAGVAWITGGASGIGLAGARALGSLGYKVVLTARGEAGLTAAADALAVDGIATTWFAADVTDQRAIEVIARQIVDGHGRLDVLLNSAGLNVARRLWGEVSSDDFEAMIDINLGGTFNAIAAALPQMRAQGSGLVINIASWAGKFISVGGGPGYSAAKAAVIALTESLNRSEFRNNIRACAICPGEVATPLLAKRAQPPSQAELDAMLQTDDLERTIRFVAEMPARACVNEIVLSPTANRGF